MRKAESGSIVSFCRSSRWTHIEIHFSQVALYSCLPPVETRRHHSKAHGVQQFYSSFTAPGDSLLDGLVSLCSPCASFSSNTRRTKPTSDGKPLKRVKVYVHKSYPILNTLLYTPLSLYPRIFSFSSSRGVHFIMSHIFREEPSWQGEFSLSSTACRFSFRLKWRLGIILFFWK